MAHKPRIKVAGYYEDSDNHPVLCTESDGDDVAGISLIDGSGPRSDSIRHGGIRKLSFKRALELREVWLLVMPPKVREAYHGKNRLQIMYFAGDIHTLVLTGATSSSTRLEDLIVNIALFAHNSSVELSGMELRAALGLALIRLHSNSEIDLSDVKRLAQSRLTPVD